jgi:hypothetical protein
MIHRNSLMLLETIEYHLIKKGESNQGYNTPTNQIFFRFTKRRLMAAIELQQLIHHTELTTETLLSNKLHLHDLYLV